jgi:hypothetical protein
METKKCYKEDDFVPRIQQALGVPMPDYTCHVVNQKEMTDVMGRAGWNKSQTRGVVGFHLKDKVWVLKDAPWTTLHELIHRAGVNADRINRHLAEGLTELIASEIKRSPDEHRATYPDERQWVKGLLKKLNMTACDLGKIIAQSKNPPSDVADLLIARRLTEKSKSDLIKTLKAQVPNAPSLNRVGSATVVEGKGFSLFNPMPLTIMGAILIGVGIVKSRGA